MNKNFKIALLATISLFTVACTNTQKAKTTSTKGNMQSSKVEQKQKPSTASVTQNTTSSKENNENKSAAQGSNEVSGIYSITQNVYKNKNITINYPQITNLGDANKQSSINQLIKNDVLAYVNSNIEADSNLELKYNVKLQTPNLLSIQYSGVGSRPSSAHPDNIFYTTNISIKDSKKLRLSGIVNVDINLANAFKKGQYVDSRGMSKDAQEQITGYVKDNISTNDLVKYFNEADSFDIKNVNQSITFSYLTKDAIVISVSVPHALGDHAEFSIPITDKQLVTLKLQISSLSCKTGN